jgi:hypothetical protein
MFTDTYLDESFIYQMKLIDIMIETTKGNPYFNINAAKLRKHFSIKYFV